MALKIYAGTDTHTGIEFIVRADTFDDAQEAASRLVSDINVASTLVADDFSKPVRLATTLLQGDFPGGAATGVNPIIPIEIYHALRLDGSDRSFGFTASSAENNFISDFQIIAWIEFLDYEGAGRQVIASNWDEGANLRSYTFAMEGGNLVFQVSAVGTDINTTTFLIDPVADTGFWVRAQFATLSIGVGQTTIFTSDQSRLIDIEDITWVQKASDITSFEELKTNTVGLRIGTETTTISDTNVPNGNIGRIVFIQGVDGTFSNNTIIDDMYPNRDTTPGETNWFSQTGEQWQIFGRASIGIPIVGGGIIGFLLDGISGTFISTPDTSPNFATTISLAIWVELVTYPQTGQVGFISKFDGTSAGDSYAFSLEDGDDFGFIGDDANGFGDKIGDDTGYKVDDGIWTAMTWDSNTREFTWYRSDDAIDTDHDAIVWTPTVVSDPISQTFWNVVSNVDIRIGSQGSTNAMNTIVGRAMVIDGALDGTLYADMFPDRDYVDGTQFTSTTGLLQEWTLTGGVTVTQV